MRKTKTDKYRVHRGLVETNEPDFERPLWRRPGFDGVVSIDDMDKALSEFLIAARKKAGLTREQLAGLLGISGPVYGRYERAYSKLNVTRLIHLSEILGFPPIEMIYAAAPHLFGDTPELAQQRLTLLRLLTPEAASALLALAAELSGDGEQDTAETA